MQFKLIPHSVSKKIDINCYIIHVFKVELRPCDPINNATMQQVMVLKYVLLQQSDDLHAGIKANCFLSAIVLRKKN